MRLVSSLLIGGFAILVIANLAAQPDQGTAVQRALKNAMAECTENSSGVRQWNPGWEHCGDIKDRYDAEMLANEARKARLDAKHEAEHAAELEQKRKDSREFIERLNKP